jgi:hypothetical protein
MEKLNRKQIHEKLGLTRGRDFTFTERPGSARVYQYTDEAVLKLAEVKHEIGERTLLEYVERRTEGAKLRWTEA